MCPRPIRPRKTNEAAGGLRGLLRRRRLQYLLPEERLLPLAAGCFGAACLALLLPGLWRKRVLLIGTGLALALGWNWLYGYAVRDPLAGLSGTEGPASMTLLEYAVPTDYGAKVTVELEGFPLGRVVYYGGEDLLDRRVEDLTEAERCELVYRRILLQRPDVVFCVQPFRMADVALRMSIWRLLEELSGPSEPLLKPVPPAEDRDPE